MRILLITGQLAKEAVEKYVSESSIEVEIIALQTPVAALLTSSQIAEEIMKRKLKGFDMILVPGLIKDDTSMIEKAFCIPTFKGPKYAADLPIVLNSIDRIRLSKTIPACEVVKKELVQKTLDELKSVEDNSSVLLKRPGNVAIGHLSIGKDFPMRVMAEILDVPLLSDKEIEEQAIYYERSGAQIIDIGMIAGKSRPKDAARAVSVVKNSLTLPVSIDTFDIDEVKAAVSVGADLLLSIDAGNAEEVAKFVSEIPTVVIPTNHKENYFPKKASERAKALEENIRLATDLGMKKIIGDPILDPVNVPGIMESLIAYREFSLRNPNIPLLFGAANVTELMDADTVGVNALLAGIASELGVSVLLTTEGSDKSTGSVRELAIASKMMFLAKKRSSVPKDLGLDLLILKDKKLRDESTHRRTGERRRAVRAEKTGDEKLDPKGFFKITLDRKEKLIVATRFLKDERKETIEGKDVEDIYRTIIKMDLVSIMSHAAYLGRELEKAEIALRIGKTYIQDEPVFS